MDAGSAGNISEYGDAPLIEASPSEGDIYATDDDQGMGEAWPMGRKPSL